MPLAAPPAIDLTTVVQTLYTCPAGTRVIAETSVSNVNASNPVTVTMAWTDASAAGVSKNLALTDIAAKDAIAPKRKVLEAGDTLTGLASANGYATASIDIVYSEPVA